MEGISLDSGLKKGHFDLEAHAVACSKQTV